MTPANVVHIRCMRGDEFIPLTLACIQRRVALCTVQTSSTKAPMVLTCSLQIQDGRTAAHAVVPNNQTVYQTRRADIKK